MKITVTEADAGQRLDKLLVTHAPGLGRAGAKRLFSAGKVRLVPAGRDRAVRADKGDVAAAGDVLEIDVDEGASTSAVPDPDAPLTLALERDDLVIVDKPAGQPSAPLELGERGTVANALAARFPEMAGVGFSPREPGLCHRLDNDTSGLLLAARTAAAFAILRAALQEGRLDKRYLLVCPAPGLPESGTIDIPLAPHPKDRRRVYPCVHPRDVARYAPRPAVTDYRVLRVAGPHALVEARAPKAARHQIRAHFAALGHPLLGDRLYGGADVPGLARHALHAHHLAFTGAPGLPAFHVESPLPPDLAALLSG
jgi:23S rRNA pseudouridine1911/1915/1917 synthase